LLADEDAPAKQRPTAMQIYRRLCDEHHYAGSYDQVRRYVARQRRDRRETFIPLAHDPGQRLEADIGVSVRPTPGMPFLAGGRTDNGRRRRNDAER
jgi:hypothetical protein